MDGLCLEQLHFMDLYEFEYYFYLPEQRLSSKALKLGTSTQQCLQRAIERAI